MQTEKQNKTTREAGNAAIKFKSSRQLVDLCGWISLTLVMVISFSDVGMRVCWGWGERDGHEPRNEANMAGDSHGNLLEKGSVQPAYQEDCFSHYL